MQEHCTVCLYGHFCDCLFSPMIAKNELLSPMVAKNKLLVIIITLVNVYVALPVFTPVAGRSYAHFMEQNGGGQYVNS